MENSARKIWKIEKLKIYLQCINAVVHYAK